MPCDPCVRVLQSRVPRIQMDSNPKGRYVCVFSTSFLCRKEPGEGFDEREEGSKLVIS